MDREVQGVIPLRDLGEDVSKIISPYLTSMTLEGRDLDVLIPEMMKNRHDREDAYIDIGLSRHAVSRMKSRRPYMLCVALSREIKKIKSGYVRQKGGDYATALDYVWKVHLRNAEFAISKDMKSFHMYVYPYGTFVINLLKRDDSVTGCSGIQAFCVTYIYKLPKWVDLGRKPHPVVGFQAKLDSMHLHEWVFGLLHRKYVRPKRRVNKQTLSEDVIRLKDTLELAFETENP